MKNFIGKKKAHYFLFKPSKFQLRIATILLIFMCFGQAGFSQNTKTITGTVVDESQEPIVGASIVIEKTANGTISDIDGKFTLNVPLTTDRLTISYIGFVSQDVDVKNTTTVSVILKEDSRALNEVVVVGYGTQRKATLTGAVSAISSEDLVVTKNQNPQNMLTGKVPGVRVIQKTSEPGEFNNQFDIRGFGAPLIVIDGVQSASRDFSRIAPEEIESISVLKDAAAAVYGVKAGNGVVLITTKKGVKGKTKIDYSMYYGLQFPAELLKPVGAIDRMTLYNEKTMRSTTNPQLTYDDAEFEAYRTGERISTDWYEAALRDIAPQQQQNISISGGSEKINYFVNGSYMKQEGFFRSKDLNYDRFNVRSKINSDISKYLSVGVNISGVLDTKNRPRVATSEVYKTLWRSVPNEGVYANDNPLYFSKPSSDINNVVAMSDADVAGYYKTNNKTFRITGNLDYKIPYVDGLMAKFTYTYNTSVSDNTTYTKEFNEYNYDAATDLYNATKKQSPTNLTRYYGVSTMWVWNATLSYKKTFAQKHNVDALILFEESKTSADNFSAFREFEIPIPQLYAGNPLNQEGTSNANNITEYVTHAIVGRLNYDFAGKYIAEFSFRRDGSSMYSKKKQWGFFPGGSLGWRISEEKFIKDNLTFVDNLKLRGSVGRMGSDSGLKYQWLEGYLYPNTKGAKYNNFPTGYMFNGVYTNAIDYGIIPNPDLSWEVMDFYNLGLDGDLWDGLLGFTVDIFKRKRSGMAATRSATVPGNFGATMPQENLNSSHTKGFEIELRHRYKVGDFSYNITGNIAMTRTMLDHVERSPYGSSYDNWRNSRANRYNDIWFGYGANGRYQSYEQIATYPVYAKDRLPGDYIYEDWNGDGVIDAMDQHPIATTTDANKTNFFDKRNYPLLNFGLNISAQYKDFDLSLMFQGSGMSYIAHGQQLSAPLAWNGNALDIFMDRWRPSDSSKDPFDPNNTWIPGYYSYGATSAEIDSDFNIQNGTYLRLKTIELGYSIPKKVLSKVGIKNTRLYINGYNLLTISGVKGMDPEHPSDGYGYVYPLNKTVSFGVNITY